MRLLSPVSEKITLPSFALFAIGFALAIHSVSRADPEAANDWFKLPNVREACTASTKRTNLCLETSLKYRCYNYGNFSLLNLGDIRACIGGVDRLMKVMNIVQVPIGEDEKNPDDKVEKSGLLLKQVLFKTDLERIFRARGTADLFRAAQADMEDSVRFGRAHNLWDSVLAATRGDRETTLKFVAEAVQDVSFGIWHIMYLGRKYESEKLPETSVPVRNLQAAQEFIQLYQTNLESDAFTFSAYPAITGRDGRIDASLHPYLHHFYLPAFLASELKRTGKTEEQAFFAAFLLNTSYEFVKLDAGRDVTGMGAWPFHDPKPFDAKAESERLRKIYTGYVGALWGIGKEREAKSLSVFSAELAKDPYRAMKGYFKTDF